MTPEEKHLHGILEANDDGFTYVHGKHKGGFIKRTRNRAKVIRMVRHDKRACKAATLKRVLAEQA